MQRFSTLFLILALAVLCVAGVAPATAQTTGINLRWTDCSTAGADNMAFACDVNTGAPFTLVGTFVPPSGVNQFVGFEAVVDVGSNSDPIGDWWRVQPGGCRAGAALASFDFTIGPFTCTDPFGGQAFGGLDFTPQPTGTTLPAPLTNKGRFKVAAAVAPPGIVLTGGTEYYAFLLRLLRTNTLTCTGGCAEAACIRLNSILVAQPAGVGNFFLTAPPAGGDQDVTWQGAGADCAAVPVQNRTWGEVKHLYR